jgi:glyoxylase-like metal-dependent hydrolase (beta-lactamase superfamily II)
MTDCAACIASAADPREDTMRMLVTAAAASAIAALAVLPATAQQPQRPPFETTKVEGTDNVYIFRNGNHQAMFIVTNDGVIATDPIAYGRPTGGKIYVDEIRKITDKPIRYLIYSHHHFDHIAGGQAFKDAGAEIIAHRRAKERLEIVKDPFTPLPDTVIGDEGRTIELGGTTLELSYVGRNHSDSTLVFRLPKERLLFVVDLIPVGSVPGLGMIDFYPMEADESIRRILAMDWDRMIPGHPGPGGRLGNKQDVQDILTLLQDASEEMKVLAREGKCWLQAEKEFKLGKYASWPNYANGLPYIARRYCGFWGRGT